MPELHTPPGVAFDRVMLLPIHTLDGPVIGDGDETTVTVLVTQQPPAVYVIVVLPVALPVTIPVVAPTEAIPGPALLHVPPGVRSVSGALCPTHTLTSPAIGNGSGLTVTSLTAAQPVAGKV
jgi:hypothetical protein